MENPVKTKSVFKKRLKRILLFILLTPVVLSVLGAVAYFAYASLALGGESTPHQQYLSQNMEAVDAEKPGNFKLFDKDFYQNRIFLLGESHGFAAPQSLDLALLKHLHTKADVRYYLAEVDYAQAHFLNEYLRTGNDSLLRYVFETWVRENAQWGNRQFYEKIVKIRAWNQSLPAENRVRFVGVDKIQDWEVIRRFLREWLAANKVSGLDALRQAAENPKFDKNGLYAAAESLLDTVMLHNPLASLTQPKRDTLLHLLQNIRHHQQRFPRDSVMYLNLKALTGIQPELKNAKMYGLWGFTHTLPGSVNGGYRPFASLLRSPGSPFRQQVVALGTYAIDSENMIPGRELPKGFTKGKPYVNIPWANSDGPLIFVNGIKDLVAVTRLNTVTLFKLNGKDSPYFASDRLTRTKVLIPGQSLEADQPDWHATDMFSHVFLIRNSPALQPL